MIHTRLKAALLSALAALAGLAACTGTGTGTDAAPAARRWQPQPRTAWQWQLSGKVSLAADVPVYDIDGFDNTAATVAALHRRGRKAICYISVGAWEDFRSDAAAFPKKVLGRSNGWDGERWLDIRRTAILRPLMAKRFDICRTKGFDAVEPDNTDGYRNRTGFKLTAADQLTFNRMIAKLAHDRGMAVGLKNDLDQIPQLLGDFDFAVNEQCAEFDECARLKPFIAAGKAVFHVEYNLPPSRFCAQSGRLGLSSMEKRLELGAWRAPCPTAVAQNS
ncbi:endo alpha-1,4 polygalactosaminidase [Actinacidiphila oryziradicis]|uniref:Endo alpha-1,4 polygalactosaminidase n=1 Tax=Actinacidiphila oryziradicis TaxID=2571141 RepID=A0A4U0SS49_9ACTN|nr:endo alpha-1,4 polygalactosaminidase [Actinacidiphila oryziradicis]TKA12806.1 endo alpha-1,4 polygalactosaminidase [Actinacidiphila oryziradicis]